jgi:PAS domain S-box-containing protein
MQAIESHPTTRPLDIRHAQINETGPRTAGAGFRAATAVLNSQLFLQLAMVFVAYLVAGKLGQATTNIRSGNLGPVWPASGIALAALLAFGYRVWPALAASAFLVAFQSPVAAVTAAGQAAGATMAAAAGAFCLRRIANFDPMLSRLRDAIALILVGGFGSALISASIGIASLYATGLPYSGLGSAWLIYWLGDATGVLLVTPLVFTLSALFDMPSRRRAVEFAVLLTLLTAACFVIFGDLPLFSIQLRVLAFAVLPFVMWAAIGFGVGGASLSVFLIATMATLLTAFGLGPFADNTPLINAALLDVLFTVLSVSGLAFAAVIAERERAKTEREALIRAQTAMETRLRLAAIVESSNDAVLSVTLDGIIHSWNAAAQRIFGYTGPEVIGQPLTILAPPELRGEHATVFRRLTDGTPVEPHETVFVTKAGEKRHVSVNLFLVSDEAGHPFGAATILRDITEQKRAQELLSTVGQRLIVAQEQERTRIARELHDDIGQRVAMLVVNLTGLTSGAPDSTGRSRTTELRRQAVEIASDVQALSHRLHSPKLELLGMTAAMRLVCEEFGEQQESTIRFSARGLPDRVPPDTSLCLFRILQEALHNAVKYSGVREFEVQLWRAEDEIHLVVSDRGHGFDVEAGRRARGLGLLSMEERIKLVSGNLSIESQLGRGTTIHARVPVAGNHHE